MTISIEVALFATKPAAARLPHRWLDSGKPPRSGIEQQDAP